MVCIDCLQALGECFDLICYAFFFRGVAGFLGFPVLHLVVLDTEHVPFILSCRWLCNKAQLIS